jgi:membrane protease YdiL (CAAX protease family)
MKRAREISMTRKKALVDLLILLVVLGTMWSLRFFGVQYVGILTMAIGMVLTAVLLHWRRQTLSDIGWRSVFRGRQLRSRTLEVMGLTGLTMVVGMTLIGTLFGAPDQSSAVSQLPDNVWLFLLDVTILTWVFIAFGEELIFRGMMLSRLETLFGLQGRANIVVASLAQGVLFGAGHASQGVTGMIITGAIGTVLAVYFMTRGRRSLVPLVISHGIIDTTVLSASWLSRTFGA